MKFMLLLLLSALGFCWAFFAFAFRLLWLDDNWALLPFVGLLIMAYYAVRSVIFFVKNIEHFTTLKNILTNLMFMVDYAQNKNRAKTVEFMSTLMLPPEEFKTRISR